jgi:hypothetical protein
MKRPFLIRSRDATLDLNRIARMRPLELQTLFRKMFGRDVPASSSEYARRRIAWHLQSEREGGLPESARQHALGLARNAGLRARVSANADRLRWRMPPQPELFRTMTRGFQCRAA